MKLSPLQLLDYFVAEFHFSLNSTFDPTKPVQKELSELEVTPGHTAITNKPGSWTVSLKLNYQPAADTNTPYLFALTLVGMVEVDDNFPVDQTELLVKTNGPSVLYSIARELIREQTARGPDGPFILPTASFVPDPPIPAESNEQRPERIIRLDESDPQVPAATDEAKPVAGTQVVEKPEGPPNLGVKKPVKRRSLRPRNP